MSADKAQTAAATVTEIPFSRLEASLVTAEVAPRPNSIEMKDVSRHTEASDLDVDELKFNFSLDTGHYPLGDLRSLQEVFAAVQHEEHLANPKNFSSETQIECLDIREGDAGWRTLDDWSLQRLVQSVCPSSATPADAPNTSPWISSPRSRSSPRRLLAFFVPLTPTPQTSFASSIAMTQGSVMDLFQSLELDPLFLLNLLGRPDYWAPQKHWKFDVDGNLSACDFFCQHPRWNLQVQGAPLSVYMRHDMVRNLTTYVISHKRYDTSIKALRGIIDIALNTARADRKSSIFLDDPFDFHVILSTLSFEASKYHVKRFQRFMWTQLNKVDDHLGGLQTSDRAKLGELTKQLQIISQNADSHIGNADVAIITANGIRAAHARLHLTLRTPPLLHHSAADAIQYVISSMEKQKIWFLNYKNRKDSTMSLVYNLVTQQDAANNIQLAADMKRDSTSMNAIAALTMAFLPGTFTATVMGAGIFSAMANSRDVHVSGIWWLWTVITVPLTLITVICWWVYQRSKAKSTPGLIMSTGTKEENGAEIGERKRSRAFSIGAFSFASNRKDSRMTGQV